MATGKRPDRLKIYENGRIIVKLGPDDDDESGLLVPETDAKDVRKRIKGLNANIDAKITPWQAARALGVPDIYRSKQASNLPKAKKMVFLSIDSPIT